MASAPVSQEVAAKYQGLMQECQQLQSKIVELEIDRNEHQ
jgi:prefoldin subunit 5